MLKAKAISRQDSAVGGVKRRGKEVETKWGSGGGLYWQKKGESGKAKERSCSEGRLKLANTTSLEEE